MQVSRVALLSARDAFATLELASRLEIGIKAVILDPWYNKGVGGVRDDYAAFVHGLLERSASVAEHVFLWGFPEILARFVGGTPRTLELVSWLTWYYKNNPSVIRGWRSSQNACLHLARPGSKLYPEHFLNERQMDLLAKKKLRYIPGPTSVIEAPLNIGFVGRAEQTGHPAQKPVSVFEKLVLMTTKPGDIILDPMCGSGTAGAAARKNGRLALICDNSSDYIEMCRRRLEVTCVKGL